MSILIVMQTVRKMLIYCLGPVILFRSHFFKFMFLVRAAMNSTSTSRHTRKCFVLVSAFRAQCSLPGLFCSCASIDFYVF
jgi:hypothetical protein